MIRIAMNAVAAVFVLGPSLPDMPGIHGFTPIPIFVPVALVDIALTVFALRARKFGLHRAAMMVLYVSGTGIAGTLAFMPGRIMHAVVFG